MHVNSVQLSDWISSINFYVDEPNSFCCLTSHSVAVHCSIVWNDSPDRATIEISEKLSCTDKSTLYTSLILGTTWHSTVLFGGTALGYVFIWRGVDNTIEMLHRLPGHNVASIKIYYDKFMESLPFFRESSFPSTVTSNWDS